MEVEMQRRIYLSAAIGLICLIGWSAHSSAGLLDTKIASQSEADGGLLHDVNSRFDCTPWSDRLDTNCYNRYGPYGPSRYDYGPYGSGSYGLGLYGGAVIVPDDDDEDVMIAPTAAEPAIGCVMTNVRNHKNACPQ